MPAQTWNQKIRRLWAADQIHGIELVFDSGVLALRYTSVSYWSKDVWLNRYLDWREISDKRRRRLWRDNLIDLYCISQFLVLCAALFCFQQRTLSALIAGYILFEMYLNLFTIFFLPRQKEIGPPGAADSPSAVNEPSTSVERSILLLFVNEIGRASCRERV